MTGMSLAAFLSRTAETGPFEILAETFIPVQPILSAQNTIAGRLHDRLLLFQEQGRGRVFRHTTYLRLKGPDWVTGARRPDVMWISAARMAEAASRDPLVAVPDLVVEIVSPSDRFTDVDRKANLYLEDGASVVWIVDPVQEKVFDYSPGGYTILVLTGGDTLTGGEALPRLVLTVTDVFT